MRRCVVTLFFALAVLALPVVLKAQEEFCAEASRSPTTTFEKMQLWNQTFKSLEGAEGLTQEQVAVLRSASKLGTVWFFQAKLGTADWKVQVEATSNAILETAYRTLPADIYAAVWHRFQTVTGASHLKAATPVCNCSTHGGACAAGGVTGTCSDTTVCATCGGVKFGVCSV